MNVNVRVAFKWTKLKTPFEEINCKFIFISFYSSINKIKINLIHSLSL